MSVKWIKKRTPAQVAADAPQVCVACNGSGKYDHEIDPAALAETLMPAHLAARIRQVQRPVRQDFRGDPMTIRRKSDDGTPMTEQDEQRGPGLHLDPEQTDFLGKVLSAQVVASQDVANRVLDFTQAERDEAQRALVALYDALAEIHYGSEVQLRAVGMLLQDFDARVDVAASALARRGSTR